MRVDMAGTEEKMLVFAKLTQAIKDGKVRLTQVVGLKDGCVQFVNDGETLQITKRVSGHDWAATEVEISTPEGKLSVTNDGAGVALLAACLDHVEARMAEKRRRDTDRVAAWLEKEVFGA